MELTKEEVDRLIEWSGTSRVSDYPGADTAQIHTGSEKLLHRLESGSDRTLTPEEIFIAHHWAMAHSVGYRPGSEVPTADELLNRKLLAEVISE